MLARKLAILVAGPAIVVVHTINLLSIQFLFQARHFYSITEQWTATIAMWKWTKIPKVNYCEIINDLLRANLHKYCKTKVGNIFLKNHTLNAAETPAKEILWAAGGGMLDVVQRLLKCDQQLTAVTDRDGYTPLHRACSENRPEVCRLLLENGKGQLGSFSLAVLMFYDCSAGANLAAATEQMWQPLHSACRWNSSLCASLLLDWGADVNAVTLGGLTPLHLAASNPKSFETLVILLNHPLLDPDILTATGDCARDTAIRSGNLCALFDIVNPAINTFIKHSFSSVHESTT